MLIDLEGLEGTEIKSEAKDILQDNLISALLIVASVPCILVSNRSADIEFVEKKIARIAKLQRDFGFCTERVHLLFHDKVISAHENEDFANRVRVWNRDYFAGKTVIVIRNKPNFIAENATSQRQLFLQTLLNDSLYVKKSQLDDASEKIQDLLTLISVITSHPSTDFREVQLTAEEVRVKSKFIKKALKTIKAIQRTTSSKDDRCLLVDFHEKINREFMRQREVDMQAMSHGLREHCRKRIDLELYQKKAEIREIEEYYAFIRRVPLEEMKHNIEDLVKYCYDSAWCLIDFRSKVKALKTKLKQVQLHFPNSNPTIEVLLETLKSNRWYYTKWSIGLFVGQVAVTAVTAGAGAVIGASSRVGLTAARAAFQLGVRMGLGLGGILGGAVNTGIGVARHSPEKAMKLVSKNWKVNEKVFMEIRADDEQPHLRPQAKAPVLLFLGSKTTLFWQFANAFAKSLSLFASAETEAFTSNQYTQILPFDYEHPGLDNTLTRSYLICLRMKKKPRSDYYQAMMKLAERLIPVASVTFLLVDDPSHYAQPLLRTLPQAMNTHLVVVHKSGVGRKEMWTELKRFGSKYGMREMEGFNKEQIEVTTGTIKEDFDRSNVQEYSQFKGRLVSLALDQGAMELIYVNSWLGNHQLNQSALREISVNEELPHLRLESPGPVLLLIGSKTTLFWQLANALTRRIAPFTPAEFEAFNPNTYTQILPFDYTHPGQGDTLTRSCLICLRMKKKPNSNYYHVMMKIAAKLIPAASLTCLLVDNPIHYAEPLDYQTDPENPMTIPRIMVIHQGNPAIGELKQKLTKKGMEYEEKQVQRFTSEELTDEIKEKWDRAEVQKYGYLKARAELLPGLLKPPK